jgi:hypothetical protein
MWETLGLKHMLNRLEKAAFKAFIKLTNHLQSTGIYVDASPNKHFPTSRPAEESHNEKPVAGSQGDLIWRKVQKIVTIILSRNLRWSEQFKMHLKII